MDYPYLNTDLRSIRGERWKNIPGLGGYFLISNYGRVKRCAYEMEYRNGAIYFKPAMIIKPILAKYSNRFVGDTTRFLSVRVTFSGQRHLFMVARMVYYCFVQQFDLTDHGIQVLAADTDNFNIRPGNLRAVSRSQKQQRVVARKRFRSPLLDLPAETRAENRQKIVRSRQRQVSQYNQSGKKTHTYRSLRQAEVATGIASVSISLVARGKNIRAGKYLWRWGKEARIDVKTFLEARRKRNRERLGMKVTQYTLSGERVARYPSLTDAKDATGASTTAIGLVMRGKQKSAKGYFWKKGYGPEKIDLTGYQWGRQSLASTLSKRVGQYSAKGKYIRTFESIKAAAAAMNVTPGTLSAASRGLQHTCRGFRWKCLE